MYKRRELKGHFGKVYAVHWAGDSIHIVSASQDGKMIVWNAMNTYKVQSIGLKSSWVMTCAFEQSRNAAVARYFYHNWNLRHIFIDPKTFDSTYPKNFPRTYHSLTRTVPRTCHNWTRTVPSGGLDNVCSVFQVGGEATGRRGGKELIGHDGYISCCRFISDRNILTSSGDSSSCLWDIEKGVQIKRFVGHVADVMCLGERFSDSLQIIIMLSNIFNDF